MVAIVEDVVVAVAGFPFCAAAAVGIELVYAAPAPDIEVRSALELYDGGDDDDDNIVG
jgi:hypothetical protein